ncbi:MAG: dihydroorotate dehydrogenase-like protein [Bacteroidales bacterium]|nr:dihydroorotate dehydrogenase-like protein [Bacteroidales bacterium]
MANLKTKYLGLELRNPVMVSSSGLTDSVDKIKKLYDNNAGAVVLKSLFEEQIQFEAGKLVTQSDYPEAHDYITNYTKSNSVGQYLDLISNAKKAVDIPIIPSINCVSSADWTSYAKDIEDAGADALELNIFQLPTSKYTSPSDIEKNYFEIVEKVKKVIKIPLVVKLGMQFSNLVNFADQLYVRGVAGVVLFNRLYQPDIDIDQLKIKSAEVFSSPVDIRFPLRWIGILSSQVEKIELSGSTGVQDGEAAIKMLLAGAKTVQVCSTVYKNGPAQIDKIVSFIDKWMNNNNFMNLDLLRGKLNYSNIANPTMYERSQFMRYFSSID